MIPFGKRITSGNLNLMIEAVIIVLGWKFLPAWFQQITKFIWRERGQSQIIILAEKR
jgi:hypothetical protein